MRSARPSSGHPVRGNTALCHRAPPRKDSAGRGHLPLPAGAGLATPSVGLGPQRAQTAARRPQTVPTRWTRTPPSARPARTGPRVHRRGSSGTPTACDRLPAAAPTGPGSFADRCSDTGETGRPRTNRWPTLSCGDSRSSSSLPAPLDGFTYRFRAAFRFESNTIRLPSGDQRGSDRTPHRT